MINILILMSGSSQAFQDINYPFPKNLVEVGGVPLVQAVLEKLKELNDFPSRFICVIRRDENIKHHTKSVINLVKPDAAVVEVAGETSGAACSALLAIEYINNKMPLLIVNGDQIISDNISIAIQRFQEQKLDGGILVFEDLHPRWSFAKCDSEGFVTEVAEKRPISRNATAGVYYFERGEDFVIAATEMIKKDARVNGLFYICPAFNELILRQKRIGVHRISKKMYHSLATPLDAHSYNKYLESRLKL